MGLPFVGKHTEEKVAFNDNVHLAIKLEVWDTRCAAQELTLGGINPV